MRNTMNAGCMGTAVGQLFRGLDRCSGALELGLPPHAL